MKYLKSFKIFESSSEDLIPIIEDVFITLDDLEVQYEVSDFRIGLIHIEIDGQSEEIDNCVEHLTNYLNDLGYKYFIGMSIKNETHISIENNFNKEIEKDFLEIIDGVKEFRYKDYTIWRIPNSTATGGSAFGNFLFNQDWEDGYLLYDPKRIYSFFESKYSLERSVINEIVRYLVGKHLKLESLRPWSQR